MNFSNADIYKLDVTLGWRYIEKFNNDKYDLHMINTINMFAAHGVDVTKERHYREYIRSKQEKRLDEAEKIFKRKSEKEIKIDPEIDKIITGKRIKKKHG